MSAASLAASVCKAVIGQQRSWLYMLAVKGDIPRFANGRDAREFDLEHVVKLKSEPYGAGLYRV